MIAVTKFSLDIEAIGVVFGILVSVTVLLGVVVNFTNKINHLESKVQYLQQELIEHSNLEGHRIIVERLNNNNNELYKLEKQLDIHLQDYINRKDLVQYMLGQLDEKVNHKFSRLYTSMKDMEKFLQKSNNFRIREYSEDDK